MLGTRLLGVFLGLVTLSQAQECKGKSCAIAAMSMSSGQPYHLFDPDEFYLGIGTCCVVRYNPSIAPIVYKVRPALESVCKSGLGKLPSPLTHLDTKNHWTRHAPCKPKVLIFAKGTADKTSALGTLGTALAEEFRNRTSASEWAVHGLAYANDVEGFLCLGIPGGRRAQQDLDTYADRCPKSKILLGGYSQGSMVVHNALASSIFGDNVIGALTFGDPFNGAPIRGYHGPTKTFCMEKDLICSGLPFVTKYHEMYAENVTAAADWILSL